jgi:hypothetical protein
MSKKTEEITSDASLLIVQACNTGLPRFRINLGAQYNTARNVFVFDNERPVEALIMISYLNLTKCCGCRILITY